MKRALFYYRDGMWDLPHHAEYDWTYLGDDNFKVDVVSIQDSKGVFLLQPSAEMLAAATEAAQKHVKENFDLEEYLEEQKAEKQLQWLREEG